MFANSCSRPQSILYAGKPVGTPDAGAYWRLITEYGIKSMFTAPTALRAIRKEDPHALLLKAKKDEIRKTLEYVLATFACHGTVLTNLYGAFEGLCLLLESVAILKPSTSSRRSLAYLFSTTGTSSRNYGVTLRA
jgi:hypothetical protein